MTKTKPKFSLAISPTFKAPVQIPVPGGGSAEIVMTFKHRTRDEFKEFFESLQPAKPDEGAAPVDGPKDVDVLLDIASGWDLEEPFDAGSLEKLVQRYMGSAQAIINVYMNELTGARLKN